MISLGSSRDKAADSVLARRFGSVCTAKSPVDMSTHANPMPSAVSVKAASQLQARASKILSSVSVPGVIRRVTARLTKAVEPRLRASAGSSVCSQMATLNPLRIKRDRYISCE